MPSASLIVIAETMMLADAETKEWDFVNMTAVRERIDDVKTRQVILVCTVHGAAVHDSI